MADQPENVQLLHLEGCELYEVNGQQKRRIAEATALSVTVVADTVCLQMGSVRWTLSQDVLVLKSAEGTYTFAVSGGDTYYLLHLPNGTAEADEAVLEEVLDASTSYQVGLSGVTSENIEATVTDVASALLEQPQPVSVAGAMPLPETGGRTPAEHIHAGSARLQAAAAAAAVYACQRIAALSDSMAARLTPADRPVRVHPVVQGVLERVARHSASAAASVAAVARDLPACIADALVARLGASATTVPAELAPGQPLATRRSAAREVAAASVLAAVDVYASMAEAAENVVHTGGAAATKLVTHKYGEDAGQATGSVASVAKSVTKVMRARRTGVSAVAARIARHTAYGLANQRRTPVAAPPALAS